MPFSMKWFLCFLLLLVAAAPLSAQRPREPIQLDNAGAISGLSVVSSYGLSVVMWKEDATQNIMAAASSDFGMTWGTPIRLDSDISGAYKDTEDWSLLIDNGRIYAAWWDDRMVAGGGTSEIFVALSDDGGLSWQGDVRGTFHYTPSNSEMEQWHWSVNLNVVCIATLDTRQDHNGREELVLYGSLDYSHTFTPWWVVYPGVGSPSSDFDLVRVMCTIGTGVPTVDIAMVNDINDLVNHNDDLLWARYDIQANSQTTAINLSPNVRASNGDVQSSGTEVTMIEGYTGPVVAFTADFPTSPGKDEIFSNAFLGSSWSGDQPLGNATIGVADVDHPKLHQVSGVLIAAWEDDRLSPGVENSVWVAYSDNGGVTWAESGPFGPGGNPSLAGNQGYVGVSFTNFASPDDPQLNISRDYGKTWGPTLNADAGQAGDADSTLNSYDPRYRAFVPVWKSDVNGGVNHAFAGYVRPATLDPVGTFSAGSPIHFDGFGFSPLSQSDLMIVGISTALGLGSALLPGDGRDIGLLSTALLRSSTHSSQTRAPITLGGVASTPTIPFPPNVPVGTTLYAVAFSLASDQTFGEITDPVTIVVQ